MKRRIALAVARIAFIVYGSYLLVPYAADDWWPFVGGVALVMMGAFTIGYEYHADHISDLEARVLRLRIIELRDSIEARRNEENNE